MSGRIPTSCYRQLHPFPEYCVPDSHGRGACLACRKMRAGGEPLAKPSTCRGGHPWTPDTSRINTQGYRVCTLCEVERKAAWYQRNKADKQRREQERRETHREARKLARAAYYAQHAAEERQRSRLYYASVTAPARQRQRARATDRILTLEAARGVGIMA